MLRGRKCIVRVSTCTVDYLLTVILVDTISTHIGQLPALGRIYTDESLIPSLTVYLLETYNGQPGSLSSTSL